MMLFASLPEYYKPLITALNTAGKRDLSLKKVKNMLLNEGDRSKDSRNSEDTYFFEKGEILQGQKIKIRKWKHKSKQGNGISMKVSQLSRRHFAQDWPKQNMKEVSNSLKYEGNKLKTACCAEDQSPDKYDNEALPVYRPNAVGKSDWITDSGATQQYVFWKKLFFTACREFKQPCVMNIGDSRTILACGKGTYITNDVGRHTQPISLREVLNLPDLDKNLLSVCAMVKLGAAVIFEFLSC